MKKAKLKNNLNKKRIFNRKVKFLFFIFTIIFSICYTTKYLIKINNITNEEYVNYLIDKSFTKKENKFLVNKSLKAMTKIDLKDPSTLLSGLIKNNKDIVYEKDAKSEEDNYNVEKYNEITSYVNSNVKEVQKPKIFLYNTHQLETYSSSGLENTNITPNVLMATYVLAENLNNKHINTIVEDTNVSEFIRISGLESDSFYSATRIFLKNAINKYDSLEYFIDIHRDSVNKEISTCEINKKKYARILFVLGVSNSTYFENEKIMSNLDKISDELYPGLSRGIYKKETNDWPLVYNQDLNKGVLLIEVGASENTIDEVMNTIDALSNILEKYMKGK